MEYLTVGELQHRAGVAETDWSPDGPIPPGPPPEVPETLSADSAPSIRGAASRGLALSTAQVGIRSLLGLLNFVILARFLSPTDYGVASLAYVFVLLLSAFAASGLGPALVQREVVDRAYIDTTFWLALTTGVVLALGMTAFAFPLAHVFGEPLLGPVLAVLSVNFIVVGLSSVQVALLQREFQFGTIARSSVIANVVATSVGIAFAIVHFGVWALVIQVLLAPSITAVLLWRKSTYRPSRAVDRTLIRPIYRVSSQFLGQVLMDFFSQQTDNFLIGARLGAVPLGFYSVGYRIIGVMMDVLSNSLRQAALPLFAKLQSQRDRLAKSYLSAVGLSALVAMPCFAFVLAAAPQIVLVVFGAKWISTVPIVRVLAIYGVLEAVMVINQVFLQGAGAARTAFRLALAGTILQIIGFFIAVSFGLNWVAAAYVVRSYVIAPIGLRRAAALIGMSTRASVARIGRPFVCSGLMALASYLTGRALVSLPEVGQLLAMGGVAVVVYGALASTVMRIQLADFRTFLAGVRGRTDTSRSALAT